MILKRIFYTFIIFGLVLVIYSLVPGFMYRLTNDFPDEVTAEYIKDLVDKRMQDAQVLGDYTDTTTSDKVLIIPKINVYAEIHDGPLSILDEKEGVRRDPITGTPLNQKKNMVISGHRFQFLPPNRVTFYNLDKMEEDDKIFVHWAGKVYAYHVTNVLVVDPSQIEVIDEVAGGPDITLYTCTPLWTAKNRLVVQGKIIEESSQ